MGGDDEAFEQLVEKAQAFAVPRNRRWFPLLRSKGAKDVISWRVDGENVTFLVGGVPRIVSRLQLLGHCYHRDNRWRWAWAEPDGSSDSLKDASVVRRFGEEHGIRQLTTPELEADALLPSKLAAVAVMLNDGDGSFPLALRPGVLNLVVLHSVHEADASA